MRNERVAFWLRVRAAPSTEYVENVVNDPQKPVPTSRAARVPGSAPVQPPSTNEPTTLIRRIAAGPWPLPLPHSETP